MPGKPVFGTINPGSHTMREKILALEALNLIKRKISIQIKGRT